MADRVGFLLGSPDGLLTHFLTQPLGDFQRWYEEELNEFPDEFDVARLSLLSEARHYGHAALKAAPPNQTNQLILEYYTCYANIHSYLLPVLHEYWDKLIVHETVQTWLKRQGHQEVATLHAYILTGRPPFSVPEPRFPTWVDYSLGYWTGTEVEQLHRAVNRMSDEERRAVTLGEDGQHALKTLSEALRTAVAQSTGLIFVMG